MFRVRAVAASVVFATLMVSASPVLSGGDLAASRGGDGIVLQRVAGDTRISTAIAASELAFPGGAADVVIARSDEFPDALAGNYLAGQLDAPILLSGRLDVPDAVVEEIARLGAVRAHVLGGTSALAPEVIAELESTGLQVTRVFGADRFATAAAIASTSPTIGSDGAGRRTAIVGSGTGFADLLAAGSLAYASKFPVLVTEPSSLSSATSDALAELEIERVLLLGGSAAVSPSVATELSDLGLVVTRLGGTNRYTTAVAVARFGLAEGLVAPDHVGVATGTSFPDALAIGPLAGKENAVTVLVGAQPVPALCTLLSELPVVAGHVAGGPSAVGESTKAALEACIVGSPSSLPDIPLDVWAPYWALDDALPEFAQRVGSLRDVSPFWFNATGVEKISIDPNALDEPLDEFLDIAERADVNVIPSIVDALPAGQMAAILANRTTRARHVQAIRAFAAGIDVDGIDINYEQFAFADGRGTWSTTRPNWVAFIAELGAALRLDGRTLAVSVPPVYDAGRTSASGYWVYDYAGIAPHVDRIRIMAYDYSVSTPGPIAPLAFVERAIVGAIQATGTPDKLVLGVGAHGRNWPVGVTGTCPTGQLQGRTSVTARSVSALATLRNATPVFVPETGEYTFGYDLEVTDGTATCTQQRRVHYLEGSAIRLRMELARQYGLDGVSLWALGYEDRDFWG